MGAGSARGRGGFVGAFGSETHRYVTGGKVHDGGGNEKRRDLAGTAFEEGTVLALDNVETADAGADMNSNALGNFGSNFQAAGLHCFF